MPIPWYPLTVPFASIQSDCQDSPFVLLHLQLAPQQYPTSETAFKLEVHTICDGQCFIDIVIGDQNTNIFTLQLPCQNLYFLYRNRIHPGNVRMWVPSTSASVMMTIVR